MRAAPREYFIGGNVRNGLRRDERNNRCDVDRRRAHVTTLSHHASRSEYCHCRYANSKTTGAHGASPRLWRLIDNTICRHLRLSGLGTGHVSTPLNSTSETLNPDLILDPVQEPVFSIHGRFRPSPSEYRGAHFLDVGQITSSAADFDFRLGSSRSCPLWSGGIEARTGLRMMPTFPRSSLSFAE
jgi:hypothetical protein